MIIYLAAWFNRHEEVNQHAAELRAMGHIVVSTWHEVVKQQEGASAPELSGDGWRKYEQFAWDDLSEVAISDTLILFTSDPPHGRGGRHVEYGYALALHKRLIIIGPREHVFHALGHVIHYNSWDEFRNGH